MKFLVKYVYGTAVTILISAGGSFAQTKKGKAPVKSAIKTAAIPAAELQAGKTLIQKSDCAACHKSDVKLVGPAFIEVAKKYPAKEASYTLLAGKIIKGGSGTWGQIPMSPHPSVSQSDAKKMAEYILSLN